MEYIIFSSERIGNIIDFFNQNIIIFRLYFLIILLYFNFISSVLTRSEIYLTIEGKGNQSILNDIFYKEPSQVLVEGKGDNSCKKTCDLINDINNITLIFDEEINSCENMFNGLTNLILIDLSKFDSSKVKNMNSMFYGCTNLKKITFGNIVTSSVQNMTSLFEKCANLTFINLSNFDTSSVITMNSMFRLCKEIIAIDASSFNTAKVEDMFDMFGYCHKLVAVNVSSFNTSKVKNMHGMFYDCNELIFLDLQNFKGDSITSVGYMFFECRKLKFLNLKLFNAQSVTNTGYSFYNVNGTYCINNLNKEYCPYLVKYSYCSINCFETNIKFDVKEKKCVNDCDENRFEYFNICFEDCPENTYKLMRKRNICSNEIPINYYLDADNIYKECYYTCKKCSRKGDINNHNCDECDDNFIFLNDSSAQRNNCYEKCQYYYYFYNNSIYSCTDNNTCPENYSKLIVKQNKCVSDCKNEDYYIYEFNNTCLEKCPDKTIYNNITNKCEEEIIITTTENIILYSSENILNDTTEDGTTILEDILLKNIQDNITNGKMNDIINNIIDTKKDQLITEGNTLYQLTTSENQQLTMDNSISTLDLRGCEDILKKKYNINDTLPLIILKVDHKSNDTLIPIVGYEIYHPENKSKLNLSYCNDSIILKVPALIDESKLFINEPNSSFYNDNCFSYTNGNGTDIILKDRKQEFIDKNLSLCEKNCTYITYDKSTKQSSCICNIKNEIEYISDIINNPNKLSNNISTQDNSAALNIMTMKCTKELFSKDGLKNNISSYILIIIILAFLISIILFMKCGYHLLEEEIKEIIDLIRKYEKKPQFLSNLKNTKKTIKKWNIQSQNKTTLNIINNTGIKNNKKSKIKSNFNKNLRTSSNIAKNNNIKKKRGIFQKKNIIKSENMNIINNKNNNINSKNKIINDNKNNIVDNNNKSFTNEVNIFVLNSLDYKDAILFDKRTFCEFYCSLLKVKHPLIFSFCPIKDYNSMIIKICISILSFGIYYTVNFMFFTEETIHKIYLNEGKYDFAYFIPKISMSFSISHIIYTIIKYIFLSERNLLQIRQQRSVNKAQEVSLAVKRNLVIKYVIFYISGIIFLSFFWMLLSSFGAVYQNTQVVIFENTLICLGIALIYPFFINIIPCIFRIPSLNSESKDQECLYNFSQLLQIL